MIAGFLMAILLVNMILWYWIPVPELDWIMHPNPMIPQIIGTVVSIPFTIILVKALKDAGRETFEPIHETLLYGSIYK